jgi:hypothetical protein
MGTEMEEVMGGWRTAKKEVIGALFQALIYNPKKIPETLFLIAVHSNRRK